MKKALTVIVFALAAILGTPAQAAPTGVVNTIANAFVKEFYQQSKSDQRAICRAWNVYPVKLVKAGARPLVRAGIAPRKAVKGVAKGLYIVCGSTLSA